MYGIINQSTDDINTLLLKAGLVSNPNLFINSDFKINQRGLTEYTASTSSFVRSVDMIAISSEQGSTSKITVADDGINYEVTPLNGANTTSNLRYMIESEKLKINQTYTMTIIYSKFDESYNALSYGLFQIGVTDRTHVSEDLGGGFYKNIVKFKVTEHTHERALIQIARTNTTSYVKYCIHSMKLEEGFIPTPFQSPDETLELLKCQSYFERILDRRFEIYAFPTDNKKVYAHVKYLRKKSIPTITCVGNYNAYSKNNELFLTSEYVFFARNELTSADIVSVSEATSNTYDAPLTLYNPGSSYIDVSCE